MSLKDLLTQLSTSFPSVTVHQLNAVSSNTEAVQLQEQSAAGWTSLSDSSFSE